MRPAIPVLAVINRKGGSGKTTLAAHIAAYCANAGMPVMLGDVDRQRSTRNWLRLRSQQRLRPAAIVGWAVDSTNMVRPPQGVAAIVLDTPGGLSGFDLAKVVMFADAILMPVCNSVFDRESAAQCHAELIALPRVASGRCKLAAVGMRLDARTHAHSMLVEWARALNLPFIGVLRETQAYVRCLEHGLTLFDLPRARVQADMTQWQPIIEWMHPVLHPEINALRDAEEGAVKPASGPHRLRPASAEPPRAPTAQHSVVPGAAQEPRPDVAPPAQRIGIAGRIGSLLGAISLTRLLHRH